MKSNTQRHPLLQTRRAALSALIATALVSLGTVHAAENVQTVMRPPLLEVPRAETVPRVDASPDDPGWNNSALIPALSLSLGEDARGLVPQPTQVRLLWDKKYLYARFICRDLQIYAPFEGRDKPHYQGDVVEMFLDAVGDARQYVELQVTPKNQIFDQMFTLTAEPRSNENGILHSQVLDRDWWANLEWNMEGLKTASAPLAEKGVTVGWIVDIAVPAAPLLRRLGKTEFEPMTLRAHLMRYEYSLPDAEGKRRLTSMNWAPVQYGCPHISPQVMGFLKLMPSSSARTER